MVLRGKYLTKPSFARILAAKFRTSNAYGTQIWVGILIAIDRKAQNDQNIVWGGWERGYHVPQSDHRPPQSNHWPPQFDDQPAGPSNYYKLLNLRPGAPMIYVRQRCHERIAAMFANKRLTEQEQTKVQHIKDGCHTLTSEHERCYYDYNQYFQDGLWEGYYSMVSSTGRPGS